MTEIPESHPRYESLMLRERLVDAVDDGIAVREGLLAHGRGEAFDYLLGEETVPPARDAERAAAAALEQADHPVISVNGNVAALAPEAVVELADAVGARIEANVFHHTDERIRRIADRLRDAGAKEVLGEDADAEIDGLDHARARCAEDGIHAADWIVVPLEDGDRAEALRAMGKDVIVVDLNPLSRSSRAASIPIADHLVRALPNVAGSAAEIDDPRKVLAGFDADKNRRAVLDHVARRLTSGDVDAFDGHEADR